MTQAIIDRMRRAAKRARHIVYSFSEQGRTYTLHAEDITPAARVELDRVSGLTWRQIETVLTVLWGKR